MLTRASIRLSTIWHRQVLLIYIACRIFIYSNLICSRSSRPEVFCIKGILRNFAKFTGKHLCQSLFFNNVSGLRPATLLTKRLWHRCFPVNFVKLLRTPILKEHLWWVHCSLTCCKSWKVESWVSDVFIEKII